MSTTEQDAPITAAQRAEKVSLEMGLLPRQRDLHVIAAAIRQAVEAERKACAIVAYDEYDCLQTSANKRFDAESCQIDRRESYGAYRVYEKIRDRTLPTTSPEEKG